MIPEIKESGSPVLAVDIGGTKIIAALVTGNGRIVARERGLTLADEGPTAVVDRLFSAIDSILNLKNMEPAQLHSICLAVAGVIDLKNGLVTIAPHLPRWHDMPLRDMVKQKYVVKTLLLNDASAAALGEHRFGAGRGVSNLILLTIGTGIGGGIISDGRLYQGTSGNAGEIGHMTVDVNGKRCTCGNVGCLETLVSGTALAEAARRRINQGEESSLHGPASGRVTDITAEDIGAAAAGGDALARDVIAGAAANLGVGLVNVVNIFNPEMIIIGGGLAKLGDLLLEPARKMVKERSFPMAAGAVRIVTARLGDDAGVCGAAVFAIESGSRLP